MVLQQYHCPNKLGCDWLLCFFGSEGGIQSDQEMHAPDHT